MTGLEKNLIRKDAMILTIKNLEISFYKNYNIVPAVSAVSLTVKPGEFYGLIGESGSGKTVTAYSILGLLSSGPGVIHGEIFINGDNILKELPQNIKKEYKNNILKKVSINKRWPEIYSKNVNKYRGTKIGMIFQEPLNALDPYFTVAEHMCEIIKRIHNVSDIRALEIAKDWLSRLSFNNMNSVLSKYPHELSGGMAQRIMIALALIHKPELLIADEPTTALDATIQKEILLLLKQIQNEYNISILFITHNLRIIKHFADRFSVMAKGHIIEEGSKQDLAQYSFKNGFTSKLFAAKVGAVNA